MSELRTIPQIRAELAVLAEHPELPEQFRIPLRLACADMRRRPPIRRAQVRPNRDPALYDKIIALAQDNPKASYMDIAIACSTTPGTVSYALAGTRTPDPTVPKITWSWEAKDAETA